MPTYRVLVVDDSAFMRKVFSDRIDADDDFTVAATASDGEEGVRLALSLKPDIITMDLEMPRMNGLDALSRIMAVRPTPIIMLSAITDNGTRDTIKALQFGAFDFIHKPDSSVKHDIRQVGDELMDKLRIAMDSVKKGTFRMLPAVEDEETSAGEAHGSAVRHQEPPPNKPVGGLPAPPGKPEPVSPPKEPLLPVNNSSSGQRVPAKPAIADPAASIRGSRERIESAVRDRPLELQPRSPAKLPPTGAAAVTPPATTRISADASARTAGAAPTAAKPETSRTLKKAEQPPAVEELQSFRPSSTFSHIVAIGTSTGGPRALHEVLTGLPGDFEAPVLVVQHMPPKFTFSLAQRLDSFCKIRVCEAKEGDKVETATAYIAPGGKQMSLVKEPSGTYRIKLTEEGPRSGHMPSVDVLFESLVGHRQLKRHVVLMTGMGSDGAKGMKALQEDGAETRIAEAEETCVVYGMPRSAVQLGAVTHQLPLQRITPILVQHVRSRNK